VSMKAASWIRAHERGLHVTMNDLKFERYPGELTALRAANHQTAIGCQKPFPGTRRKRLGAVKRAFFVRWDHFRMARQQSNTTAGALRQMYNHCAPCSAIAKLKRDHKDACCATVASCALRHYFPQLLFSHC